VDVLASDGARWSLAGAAAGLARHRMLVVIASRDGDDCKALALLPGLKAAGAKTLKVETLESDHSFNDRRIALEGLVLEWLAGLRAAPGRP
jgi:hypothetical protein